MHEVEMNLNVARIREEREKRAWTQEQLAEVSGLGLRTVQRIEATGIASFESAASLSSALAIPVSDLRVGRATNDPQVIGSWRPKVSVANHVWSLLITLAIAAIVSPPQLIILVMIWSSLWLAYEIGLAIALRRISNSESGS